MVKASQPEFLAMVACGVLILSTSLIALTIDDDRHSDRAADIACMVKPWLMTIGFTTIFSALFAKTWRVNRIFHNPDRFRRIKVTVKDVIGPYIALLTVNIIALICWTVIDPLAYERFDSAGTDDWNRVIATVRFELNMG